MAATVMELYGSKVFNEHEMREPRNLHIISGNYSAGTKMLEKSWWLVG